MHELLRKRLLVGSVTPVFFIERLAEDKVDLVAVQDAHPLGPRLLRSAVCKIEVVDLFISAFLYAFSLFISYFSSMISEILRELVHIAQEEVIAGRLVE